MNLNKNLLYYLKYVLIIVSVIILSSILIQRHKIEKSNNTVELIIEYRDLEKLSNQSDLSVQEWINVLKDNGLNTIALHNKTLYTYINEKGIYNKFIKDITNSPNYKEIFPEELISLMNEFDTNSILLSTNNINQYKKISETLKYFNTINFKTLSNNSNNYIIIEQTEEDLIYNDFNKNSKIIIGSNAMFIPLGYDEDEINMINNSGLNKMLRPLNYMFDTKGAFALYRAEIDNYGKDSNILLTSGNTILGYSRFNNDIGYIDEFKKLIDDYEFIVGVVESDTQLSNNILEGANFLKDEVNYNKFVRVFNTWPYIAARYDYLGIYEGPKELTNTYFRAITERNVRAIYLRPFLRNENVVSDVEGFEQMLTELEDRIEKYGLKYGNATTFKEFEISSNMLAIISMLSASIILLYVNELLFNFKNKYIIILLILMNICIYATLYLSPNTVKLLITLLTAVSFATLGTLIYKKKYLLGLRKNNILTSVVSLAHAVVYSLLGAMFLTSMLSSTDYLLEFSFYRGVKLSLILPMILIINAVAILYTKELKKDFNKNFMKKLKESTIAIFNHEVKIYYLIILCIVGIGGILYILRSGNATVEVPTYEIVFRNMLEENLFARPRTKEFLIFFPITIVGAYYANKLVITKNNKAIKYLYTLCFGVAASLGQASILNTFSHLRTPFYFSVGRTLIAFGIGTLLGILYIMLIKICKVIIDYFIRKISKNNI